MARTAEDIIKEQLGNLLLQLSVVQSQAESLMEKNKELTVALEEIKQGAKEEKKV